MFICQYKISCACIGISLIKMKIGRLCSTLIQNTAIRGNIAKMISLHYSWLSFSANAHIPSSSKAAAICRTGELSQYIATNGDSIDILT